MPLLPIQEAADVIGQLVCGAGTGRGGLVVHQEVVDQPVLPVKVHLYVCLAQPVSVGLAQVA